MTCTNAPPNALEYLQRFEAIVRQNYQAGSPRLEHLVQLTRLNVYHAINQNVRAIGMDIKWTYRDDSISIFNLSLPSPGFCEDRMPPSLRPTEIQRIVPHHPWLDFFPFPPMRDMLIMTEHLFDDIELCHDLMAFWDTRDTQATLLVWGNPWEPRNWEVTNGFAAKWGWLLRGSPDLLASTNYWRKTRGEELLIWNKVNPH